MKNNDKEVEPGIFLRDHVYDGIEEFDQKLPNWWLFTLYITIVAFIIYWVAYYQLPLGMKSDTESVDLEVAALEEKRDAQLSEMIASISDDALIEMSQDASHVEGGKAIFDAKCLACHGPDLTSKLQGLQLPGVNLVDSEWLYGGSPLAIMNTVTNGSPDISKGMIPWKTQLAPPDIAQVVAFVLSKQPESYDPANAPATAPAAPATGTAPAAPAPAAQPKSEPKAQ